MMHDTRPTIDRRDANRQLLHAIALGNSAAVNNCMEAGAGTRLQQHLRQLGAVRWENILGHPTIDGFD